MRIIRSFLTLLLLFVVVSATAQTQQIVVVNGKKCIVHTIGEGDTLYSLAKHYDVSLKSIVEINNGIEAENLSLGLSIYIPYNAKAAKRNKALESMAKVEETPFIDHTIAAGDTLYSIAKHYKIDLDTLLADNEGLTPEALPVGATIKIRKDMVGTATIKDIDKDIKRREKRAEQSDEGEQPAGAEKSTEGEQPAEGEPKSEEISRIEGADSVALAELSFELIEQAGRSEVDSLEQANNIRIPEFKRFEKGQVLNVALMLPMHRGGKAVPAFVDFYRGSLLALEDLRRNGYSVNVSVYDTERSAIRISEIVDSEAFASTDLIVGPIYAEELSPVISFAQKNNIPVVTPLSDINPAEVSSPVLFQMQADGKYRYGKYAHLLDGSHQINIIYGPTNDNAYLQELLDATQGLAVRHINAVSGAKGISFFMRNADGSNGAAIATSGLTAADGRSVVAVVADRDFIIEKVLMTIGELVKKSTRGVNDCVVIGSRKWDSLDYMDRTGFFECALSIITPYNLKRIDNNAIKVFESRFLSAYGILPTPYAGRGYDAMMMFCTKMFTGLDKYILLDTITPLATPYKFKFEDGMFVNSEWVNIQYHRNFTVTYE
jgi:LysM repeat protein